MNVSFDQLFACCCSFWRLWLCRRTESGPVVDWLDVHLCRPWLGSRCCLFAGDGVSCPGPTSFSGIADGDHVFCLACLALITELLLVRRFSGWWSVPRIEVETLLHQSIKATRHAYQLDAIRTTETAQPELTAEDLEKDKHTWEYSALTANHRIQPTATASCFYQFANASVDRYPQCTA